ncbi:MAG: cupin domain-containing protein [Gemmatimonadetes bacterium]|nr:cupin domain-containing protein [Gemmatimonadota bacterium]
MAATPELCAPDGSKVRELLGLPAGGMAHFELAPGQISIPVAHRTVEEIWLFLHGQGQMWRRQGEREEIVEVCPGVSITIPLGTSFQFRCTGSDPLAAVGVTMPPWPGAGEAYEVAGKWEPTITLPS